MSLNERLLRLVRGGGGGVPRRVRCSTCCSSTPALRSLLDPCHHHRALRLTTPLIQKSPPGGANATIALHEKRRWLVIAGSLVALATIVVAAGAWTYQNTHRVKIVWVKPTYALASHHRSAKPKPLHAFGHPRQLAYPVLQYGSENSAVLRLQQLLAHHGYLPVSFKAKGEQPLSPIAPRSGSFHWAFSPPPGARGAVEGRLFRHGDARRGDVV